MSVRFLRNLAQSQGVRQSFLTIFGNFASSALAAISLIIGSRLLGPSAFGTFSVGFSLVLILARINEAGLTTAVLKYATPDVDKNNRNAVYSLVLRYKLILSVLLGVGGLIFAEQLAQFMNLENPMLIRVAFTLGLSTVYYEYLLSVLQSLHAFSKGVVINLIQAGIKLIAALGLFTASSVNAVSFFAWYSVAPLAPVLLAPFLLPRWVRFRLWVQSPAVSKKILLLTRHASVAFISAGIIENVDVLFLQKYLSSYEAGLYGGVSRIAMVFAVVAYSLGNVLNARVARYTSFEHMRAYIKKAIGMGIVSLLGFLLFLPVAQPLLLLTIGEQYASGLPYLLILAAASFLAIASIPFIALFYAFEAHWYFSVSGLGQLLIVLAGNALFVPLLGLEAAAWTRFATRLFLFIFTAATGLWLYHRQYQRKII